MRRYRRHPATRRPAFSLVEILTVVGIIGLLLAILLPSLANMRKNARDTAIRGMLKSIGGALDTFSADFGAYPDSSFRPDPINWGGTLTSPNSSNPQGLSLSGAHWLARTLVGHDFQGLDAKGETMKPGSGFGDIALTAIDSARKTYLDLETVAKDTNTKIFPTASGDAYTQTDRLVVYEPNYSSPVLYYRANTGASEPFCYSGEGNSAPGAARDRFGIYRQQDNARIAGTDISGIGPAVTPGWNFTGQANGDPLWQEAQGHPLRRFGWDPDNANKMLSPSFTDRSFVGHLADRSVLPAGSFSKVNPVQPQWVRPVNAEQFILLTAGQDGLFGTVDDVGNFTVNP